MGKFKDFLIEEETGEDSPEELLQLINDQLAEMDEYEISMFGGVLYYMFFDEEDTSEDDYEDFTIEDVNAMIAALGEDMYPDVLDLLLPEEEEDDNFDWDSIDLDAEEDTNEAVSRAMKRKNFNRKKRKFFKNTKADLRKNFAKRKKANRLNKAKRRKFYRANKNKLALYKKSRSRAIKKFGHHVKIRKPA